MAAHDEEAEAEAEAVVTVWRGSDDLRDALREVCVTADAWAGSCTHGSKLWPQVS